MPTPVHAEWSLVRAQDLVRPSSIARALELLDSVGIRDPAQRQSLAQDLVTGRAVLLRRESPPAMPELPATAVPRLAELGPWPSHSPAPFTHAAAPHALRGRR